MRSSIVVASLVAAVSAQLKGFNYGATLESGACQTQDGFASLFQRASNLAGTSGFNTARLYTSIQCGTTNSPSAAFQAAIDTNTQLLLGMWASAGSDAFNQEITALKTAISNIPNFADHVVGISVGSEDLYRSSAQGVANNAGVGADASAITDYIGRVKNAISGTSLAQKPVGHVDTWTAWVLPENAEVISAVDFLGHNSFPYFETTHANSIDQGKANFYSALQNTESVAGGKDVWVTETGWPHTGPSSGQAIASTQNAETYWQEVGCSLFGTRNTFWYTLEDANTAQTEIEFGVTSPDSSSPLYDLSCNAVASSSSSTTSTTSASSTTPIVIQSPTSTSVTTTTSSTSSMTSSSSSSSSITSTSMMTTSSSSTSASIASSSSSSMSSAPISSMSSVVLVTSTASAGATTITSVAVVAPSSSMQSASNEATGTTSSAGSLQTTPTGGATSLERGSLLVGLIAGAVALL